MTIEGFGDAITNDTQVITIPSYIKPLTKEEIEQQQIEMKKQYEKKKLFDIFLPNENDFEINIQQLKEWYETNCPNKDIKMPSLPFLRCISGPPPPSGCNHDWCNMYLFNYQSIWKKDYSIEPIIYRTAEMAYIYGIICSDPKHQMPEYYLKKYTRLFIGLMRYSEII